MLAAVRAFGPLALSRPVTDEPQTAEICGSQILQIVILGGEPGEDVSAFGAELGAEDDEQRETKFEELASDAFDQDSAAATRAADLIAAYHRQRAFARGWRSRAADARNRRITHPIAR